MLIFPAGPWNRSVFRAFLVIVESNRVRITQQAQDAARRLRGGEAVSAEQVEVLVFERGEPGHVLVSDLVALGAELSDSSVDVSGRPEHDGVQNQAQRAELVPIPSRYAW